MVRRLKEQRDQAGSARLVNLVVIVEDVNKSPVMIPQPLARQPIRSPCAGKDEIGELAGHQDTAWVGNDRADETRCLPPQITRSHTTALDQQAGRRLSLRRLSAYAAQSDVA
jgi:hypothetical protein